MTPKAGSASRTAELAEELKAWCAKRGIGPEEIDSEELQAWCVKHKVDPTTARRIIQFAARHGGRWNCSGCEHCAPLRAVTASPGDDVRDVRAVRAAWAERFPLLGGLPSDAARPELDREIAALLGLKADGSPGEAPGEVEIAYRASEASYIRLACEASDDPDEPGDPLELIARSREVHRERERRTFVQNLAAELEGMDPKHAERAAGAVVDDMDDDPRIIMRIPLVGPLAGTRVILAQDAHHAERARELAGHHPDAIDYLDDINGIKISLANRGPPTPGVARLAEEPSAVTLDAVRDWPRVDLIEPYSVVMVVGESCEARPLVPADPDRKIPELHGPSGFMPHQRGEMRFRPMSLWSALRLDAPATPTELEITALEKRAQDLRTAHDHFVKSIAGGAGENEEHDAYRALQLRCEALIATREWLDARRLARAKPGDDKHHRRERLAILAERLRVGEPGGWTAVALARLILASAKDWTVPPCPKFVAHWNQLAERAERDRGDERDPNEPEAEGDPEELAKAIRRDLEIYARENASS